VSARTAHVEKEMPKRAKKAREKRLVQHKFFVCACHFDFGFSFSKWCLWESEID
jgi:hypothetical protein